MDSDNELNNSNSESLIVLGDDSREASPKMYASKDRYEEAHDINPYSRYVCYGLIGAPNKNVAGYGDDI